MTRESSPDHPEAQAAKRGGMDTAFGSTPREVASGGAMGWLPLGGPTVRKVANGAVMGRFVPPFPAPTR